MPKVYKKSLAREKKYRPDQSVFFCCKAMYTVAMNKLYVGRHGQYADFSRTEDSRIELTTAGIEQARRMGAQLLDNGFGRNSLVVSSTTTPAVESSRIIRAMLETPYQVRSEMMLKAGLHPEPVRDLRAFTSKVIEACGMSDDRDVVLIAHRPLAAAVAGRGNYADGQVFEVPDGWVNPVFEASFEWLVEEPESWRV